MECKSCGSVKFKRIQYNLFECEYCGRQVEIQDMLQVDNSAYSLKTIELRYCILDPIRTTAELENRIKENQSRINELLKRLRDSRRKI